MTILSPTQRGTASHVEWLEFGSSDTSIALIQTRPASHQISFLETETHEQLASLVLRGLLGRRNDR